MQGMSGSSPAGDAAVAVTAAAPKRSRMGSIAAGKLRRDARFSERAFESNVLRVCAGFIKLPLK